MTDSLGLIPFSLRDQARFLNLFRGNSVTSGLIAINLAAVIFGTAALFGKLDISPVWIVAARGAFAALTLAGFGWLRGEPLWTSNQMHLKALGVSGTLLCIHWLTFFVAVQWAGVAVATLTFAAFPLFTVLLSALAARRWPDLLEAGAGFAILFAVGLLVDVRIPGTALWGALAGLISALTFAYFGLQSKQLTTVLPAVTVSLAQNMMVALLLLPLLPWAYPMPTQSSDWFWLGVLGVVTTALMHQLYLFALRRLSATVCSGFIALEPVYAVAFAARWFQEPLTGQVVISGGLILGASFVLLWSEKRA